MGRHRSRHRSRHRAGPVTTGRDGWASRSGFLLATIGSAIGIGSIWKFPYEVGANGGGAFVVVYALGLALVVVPLLLAEFALGRRGGADAATSLERIAAAEHAGRQWRLVGVLGAVSAFLILSFYAVIGGWTLAFAVKTATTGLVSGDAAEVAARFDGFLASPGQMILAQAAFLVAVTVVVARGVQRGIESAMKLLMPLLTVLLVALACYTSVRGDAAAAVRFLFVPRFDQLGARAVLDALGLGFFSIGVGLGLMITYAAYSSAGTDLRQVAITSVLADTAVSLVAGMAVFPIVFAQGLDPASGPGLVFVSLPLAFATVPFGRVAATAFFLLLFVAALGSAVAMLEGVSEVAATALRRPRRTMVVAAGLACFVAGLATVGSFNWWAHWHPLDALGAHDATVFDLIDRLTSDLLLPLGGLALAVFTGWVTGGRVVAGELGMSRRGAMLLGGLLRYVVPGVVVATTAAALFG